MDPDRPLTAIGLRVLATVFFSVMFALGKLVQARGVNLIELAFFRQSIACLPVLALVVAGPGIASLRTQRPMAHVSRAAVGLTGMMLSFATVALLPLPEAHTLWFTTPMFATLLAAVLLGEHVGIHRWSAVAVGFIGVLIVVQPQSGHLPMLGATVGLAAALFTACVAILLRQIGRTEAALTTVFWFGALSTVPLGAALPWFLHSHNGNVWTMLIVMGCVGGMGQILFTISLRLAPVSTVAPVDYASLIWSALLGLLLFGTLPTPWTWVGAPIVIVSGLYIVWRERRLRRAAALIIV